MIPADAQRAHRLAGGWLLALDPGLEHPAIAIFDRGVLAHAGRVRVPGVLSRLDRGERCRQVATLIVASWRERSDAVPVAVVAEWPQVYRASRSKGDPNGLLPLVALGVAVATHLECELVAPLPSEWIGSVPKVEASGERAWDSPRGQLVARRLDRLSGAWHVTERSCVVSSHDAIDAAGIGLWALGRLEHAYVGAT